MLQILLWKKIGNGYQQLTDYENTTIEIQMRENYHERGNYTMSIQVYIFILFLIASLIERSRWTEN
jgi:hypothetical protein